MAYPHLLEVEAKQDLKKAQSGDAHNKRQTFAHELRPWRYTNNVKEQPSESEVPRWGLSQKTCSDGFMTGDQSYFTPSKVVWKPLNRKKKDSTTLSTFALILMPRWQPPGHASGQWHILRCSDSQWALGLLVATLSEITFPGKRGH